jgi:hypothetical protein
VANIRTKHLPNARLGHYCYTNRSVNLWSDSNSGKFRRKVMSPSSGWDVANQATGNTRQPVRNYKGSWFHSCQLHWWFTSIQLHWLIHRHDARQPHKLNSFIRGVTRSTAAQSQLQGTFLMQEKNRRKRMCVWARNWQRNKLTVVTVWCPAEETDAPKRAKMQYRLLKPGEKIADPSGPLVRPNWAAGRRAITKHQVYGVFPYWHYLSVYFFLCLCVSLFTY